MLVTCSWRGSIITAALAVYVGVCFMPRNAAAAVPSAVTSMISHLRRRSIPTTFSRSIVSSAPKTAFSAETSAGYEDDVCVRIGSDL